MVRDALHIWPRGSYMLIALPNEDGSFTATLFLAKHGAVSFEALTEPAAIEEFLSRNFPDVRALMPDCIAEFKDHPVGFLGTVAAHPWHYQGMTALIGDSAHAIVPFHGQGMNCCFEDCVEFDACLGWRLPGKRYSRNSAPCASPIPMRSPPWLWTIIWKCASASLTLSFSCSRNCRLELERRHPQRFIPRYSMVMFHHEIPYKTALERGAVQARLLAELTAGRVSSLADIDFARADIEVRATAHARSSVMKL